MRVSAVSKRAVGIACSLHEAFGVDFAALQARRWRRSDRLWACCGYGRRPQLRLTSGASGPTTVKSMLRFCANWT